MCQSLIRALVGTWVSTEVTRVFFLAFAVAWCATAAQISVTQTGDLGFSIQGNAGSLSIDSIPNSTITIDTITMIGTPSSTFMSGSSPLNYTFTAQTNAIGDLLKGSIDAISDISSITVGGGSLILTLDPDFNFNLAMSGPTLASVSMLLEVEQFNVQTSQWDELRSANLNVNTTTSGQFICTDCVATDMVTISNSTAEFRLHSHFDYTVELDAATPEPGTLGLLIVPLAAAMWYRRLRR
jgi:hypothetical protein